MKFSISREALIKPLNLVAGVVERRQTLPILSNVLVVLEGKTLSLTGTDLEVELVGRVELDAVGVDGEITVPARKLVDITTLCHCNFPISNANHANSGFVQRTLFLSQGEAGRDLLRAKLEETHTKPFSCLWRCVRANSCSPPYFVSSVSRVKPTWRFQILSDAPSPLSSSAAQDLHHASSHKSTSQARAMQETSRFQND